MAKDGFVTKVDVVNYLKSDQREKCPIVYPFDGSLNGNPNDVLTKVLFINYRESTQIKNKDIEDLVNHIQTVISNSDYDTISTGELNDKYYSIIDKIAHGHGICGTRNKIPTQEFNLTSFASKFCGSHNQKAPFWDNVVYGFLNKSGYKHKYRDYPAFVEALKKFQSDNELTNFSLRDIEAAIWKLIDDYDKQHQ